jgi:DNA polymerase-3 subunit epsilon
MNLNLNKDLCFFDIESTGLNVIRDRIIQIALVKYKKRSSQPEELTLLINPGIPISPEAMSVHGITPKDVARKPVFAQVANLIYEFIGDADLAGYNISRFDVPMLIEEFDRVGIDFDVEHRRLIDVQRIFYKMEPRNLKAALRFYCNLDFEDAHDALADVKATIQVFEGQLRRYEGKDYIDDDGNVTEAPVKNDIAALHNFTQDTKTIDVTNRLRYDENGEVVFNFGKYSGQAVKKVLETEPQYCHWILNKDFSVQVKRTIGKIIKEQEKLRRNKAE